MLSGDQGPYVAVERLPSARKHAVLFNPSDYSDYDRWINVFFEASARLDALETAVTDVRHLLRYSDSVHSEEIVKVLEQHGV